LPLEAVESKIDTDIQKWHCGTGDAELENHLFQLMKSIFNG
jgi:hypothetical protein